MAKDKERTLNPAAQQRKVDKNKALKKAKVEKQAQRNERLARRNPDRIQRQIDDLKALESTGEIKPREKTILADLERDLKAIHKARETLGDKALPTTNRERPQHDRNRGPSRQDNANHTVLGKRRFDGQRKSHDFPSSGSETDESVRDIPMPKDTPPPLPRNRMPYNNGNDHNSNNKDNPSSSSANTAHTQPHALPPRPAPVTQAKTTYSSAPQIRDLKKEATSRFVPTAVKIKQDAVKGVGGLLEPEEFDRLEQAGYTETARKGDEAEDDGEAKRLAEEEARFERELGLDQDQNPDVEMQVDVEVNEAGEKEGEEDSDGEVYSPPMKSGAGGGGLFSRLPQPTAATRHARQVEMEEVEDEDL